MKMTTNIFKIITLLLILAISLCSCDVIIPTHTHTFTLNTTPPTCTEAGVITSTCECGYTETSVGDPATGHSFQNGKCTICKVADPDYVAHTHEYTSVVTAPTCTAAGYTTHTCVCGDRYVDSSVVANGHSFSNGKCTVCQSDDPDYSHTHEYTSVVTAPTCTAAGYTTHTCECGDKYIDSSVVANGHSYNIGTCTVCGAKDPDYASHTHSYTNKVTSATCTENGFITYTCECGYTFTTDLISKGHNYTTTVTDPTCTTNGYTTYKCTKCGDTYVDDEIIAGGHQYSAKVTAPTCTTDGFTTYTCACGSTYTSNEVKSSGHNYDKGLCLECGEKDPNYEPFDYSKVPEYTTENYCVINNNTPYFTPDEITSTSFESYSDLDSLGRVGVAFASLGKDTLPTGSRPSISYNPTGWVQKSYPASLVPQSNIYNRSHLIAWSLSGEGNNENNLMTGTPYFNQIGMQIYETLVLDYIKETGNHVMYRVTPVFVGNELLARGVLMEGWSVEDDGEGICFCVFMYNVQPGITLEYATGENYETDASPIPDENDFKATLVTDVSQLKAGDKIIIVAKDTDVAISIAQTNNNRSESVIAKDGNIVYFDSNTQVITLGNGLNINTYSLGVEGGYLYAANSTSNYLRTQASLDYNGSWSIEISPNGNATIKATGSNTRNWLRYNPSNHIFSAYGSGQKDICIYIVNE